MARTPRSTTKSKKPKTRKKNSKAETRGGERAQGDKRWQYGAPPAGNANFAAVAACN